MDLKETVFDCAGWLQMAQDRVQWRAVCEHYNETSDSINDGEFAIISFARIFLLLEIS
jgi:hypothetical protein